MALSAYNKTTWTERIRQFASRFTLSNISGSTYDLTRVEGTVSQNGTPMSITNMNKIEAGIEAVTNELRSIQLNKCGLSMTGNQTITNNTLTPVLFDSTQFDENVMRDGNTIKIKSTGVYRVDATITWEQDYGSTGLRILVVACTPRVGTYIAGDNQAAVNHYRQTQQISFVTNLFENEVLYLIVEQLSGGNLVVLGNNSGSSSPYFSITKVA
jgi:hypothetical protein